ncbi:beta-galactosidase-like protein [Tribolium castaneum]|uniref:Beta-galactosidase n=1 Tax=Tribolium castaneum TaxID=7070 RepID=D6WCM8_TRICA|nr:PREDICTED: beta-galactosidase-1-like protein 2 [Tribolium castaneum]EEZ99315.1 beta-galactosidase-like protein [Tribolium castaneum]|eukprot:XP_967491.1 PREDICTED: beta-galactosidase-1-like protein 2 [Tribolium castaneum]
MASPPTLYEYYTSSGISDGLSTKQTNFTLNNKPLTIFSGALHYFRVPQQYWRDRLRKIRAAGLNTVETYVPWNLHEPQIGIYDFGQGGSDFSEFLYLEKFLKLAQEEDLLAIVRPGPYICAEWDFGGLPSWLLRENVKVRTSEPKFMSHVTRFFTRLLPILAALQFTKGGPIVAFQVENEYGNTKNNDTEYLTNLKVLFEENGIRELLFTSDTPSNGFSGTLPGILATANFQDDARNELALLRKYQPDKPLMVMEYWTGWFDHWTEKHHQRSSQAFGAVLDEILSENSSVNMYMFHGGTNWGFLNGANIKDLTTDNSAYQPDTTSYDYDAPLSEAGDYTDKYHKVKELVKKYNTVVTKVPEMPELIKRSVYTPVQLTEMLTLDDLIQQSANKFTSDVLKPMEMIGQSYGYINYRQRNLHITPNSTLKIEGHVCDTVLVLINGQLKSKIPKNQSDLNNFGFWRHKDSTLDLGPIEYKNATVDLLVENFGRSNYGKLNQFNQFKGLWQGNVLLNDAVLHNWEITPLEFKTNWTNSLQWKSSLSDFSGPRLFKGVLNVQEVYDTYLDMREWTKGFVIINGFVLGRFWKLGPQQSLYLPGAFLKTGANSLVVFEHFEGKGQVKFVKDSIFETCN